MFGQRVFAQYLFDVKATMGIYIFEALQMLECGPQFGKPESHLTCQISPPIVLMLLFHHDTPRAVCHHDKCDV